MGEATEQRAVIVREAIVISDKGTKSFKAVKTDYADSKPAKYNVDADCPLWEPFAVGDTLDVAVEVKPFQTPSGEQRKVLFVHKISKASAEQAAPQAQQAKAKPGEFRTPTQNCRVDAAKLAASCLTFVGKETPAEIAEIIIETAIPLADYMENGRGLERAKNMVAQMEADSESPEFE